ncbi:hypothetical protein ACFV97_02545 [Streptomyces sp. NPDC059913]|uniref:hypothetical protein n=1 Tax=unclassified Streptomyces TaxID=2593676 RepID=UPI00366A3994
MSDRSDRDHLLHLVDRARRRNILPAELDQLADGIARQAARIATLERTEAVLARVRALHRDAYAGTAQAGASCTAGCGTWPCPTTRALDDPHTT